MVIVSLIKNVGKPTFNFTDFLHFILPFTTDKQIIKLEIQRIKLEYEKQLKTSKVNDIELFEESNIELKRHLLILVEYYLGQLKYFKELDILSQKDIDFIKKRIAYIEILLNMKNGLYYETFLCFAEELERIEKLNQNNKIKSQKY